MDRLLHSCLTYQLECPAEHGSGGTVSGLAGPEAGPLAKMAVGALSSAAGQMASNAMSGKSLMDGVGQAAAIGGITGGLMEGAGSLLKGGASEAGEAAESSLSEAGEATGLTFQADTLVATPKGEQTIGSLKVGDHVQSYNPSTKTVSTQTVQQVFLNHDTDLIDVTLSVHPVAKQTKPQQVAVVSHGSHAPPTRTEVVHTTQKHPWLMTKGWITAGQPHLGDQVQQLDGSTATVVGLKVIAGTASMYDLTVSNVHTFVVGNGQFVVHNCSNEALGESGNAIAKNLHDAIPDGIASDKTTVSVGFLQRGEETLTVVSTNTYKRVGIIRPLAQQAGYFFKSGAGHAEVNIMRFAEQDGWDVLALGTSRPACPDCANMMRSAGYSGSGGISLMGGITRGLRNIVSWWM